MFKGNPFMLTYVSRLRMWPLVLKWYDIALCIPMFCIVCRSGCRSGLVRSFNFNCCQIWVHKWFCFCLAFEFFLVFFFLMKWEVYIFFLFSSFFAVLIIFHSLFFYRYFYRVESSFPIECGSGCSYLQMLLPMWYYHVWPVTFFALWNVSHFCYSDDKFTRVWNTKVCFL